MATLKSSLLASVIIIGSFFCSHGLAAALDRSVWTLTSSINEAGLNNTIDGDLDSRWTTTRQPQQPDQYIQIDLGSIKRFAQIFLDSANSDNDQPRAYEIFISNDENNFGGAIAEGTGSADGQTWISFTPVSARYIRIVQTGDAVRNWWSIHELNVYDGGLDRSDWTLSASINTADLSNAIDDNLSTRWTTYRQPQQPGQYFQIDLGAEQTFDSILLDSSNSEDDQPNSYEVYVSNDENDFGNPIATGSGGADGLTYISFSPVLARHIRIVQTGSMVRNWWSIHEIHIFAAQNSSLLPESFNHVVTYEGESVTLNLTKFSSRGPLFSVFVQDADGNLVEVESVDENRAYIGVVQENPEAYAGASIRADGSILATVFFPDEMTWRDQNGEVSATVSDFTPSEAPTVILDAQAGSDIYAAEVFVDLPYSYIEESGGDVAQTLESLEYNFALMNATFMRDAGLLNRLGKIVMRTTLAEDPYADFNTRPELFEFFRAQELPVTELSSGGHDIAALFSPQAAGIATLSSIRVSSGFMLAGTRQNGNGYFVFDGRHELGHIWGSLHDEGGIQIEGPTIMETGNTNPFGKFAAPSISKMLASRDVADSRDVLDNLGGIAPALPPRAADDLVVVSLGESEIFEPMQNDNDVNGDAISIVSVPTETYLGNSVTLNGDSVTVDAIVSPINGSNYDWFRYTIEDSSGLTSTAVVHITLGESASVSADAFVSYSLQALTAHSDDGSVLTDHIYCEH